LSCGQILSGIAREGYSVVAIAPITAETTEGGDRFAAAHPEINAVRYLLPEYDNGFCPTDFMQVEQDQVREIFSKVVKSFHPDLVISGRESFARQVPALGASYNLPVIQWVRGGPYAEYSYWTTTEDGRKLILEFQRANRIIAVADHLTNDLKRLGFENVKTIPNAIDLEAFRARDCRLRFRQELQIGHDQAVVLVPANIIPRKRPYDILGSAAEAIQKNSSLIYVMAGAGWQRSEVKQACEERGLIAHFRFPGWVDYNQMPDLYNAADIVVMASEAEGLARAYIEAMACEKLLIATEIPSAREMVTDGVNGLLFPVGDTERLTQLTIQAIGDQALQKQLGKEARLSVKHRSLDLAVEEYVREIEAVTAPTAPSGRS
jgi:glycosyltransferase involved in cell wall biosynthesis